MFSPLCKIFLCIYIYMYVLRLGIVLPYVIPYVNLLVNILSLEFLLIYESWSQHLKIDLLNYIK